MHTFINLLKKMAGFSAYKSAPEIINFLREIYPDTVFDTENMLLLSHRNQVRIWLVWNATHILVIGDNGYEVKPMLNRKKEEFSFHIIYENNQPRLYINHTITTLPIDSAYTGRVKELEARLNHIIQYSKKEALELTTHPMD